MKDINYSSESEFNSTLEEISRLYEEGKEGIQQSIYGVSQTDMCNGSDIAFGCLQKLRDLACNLLKRVHEQNVN